MLSSILGQQPRPREEDEVELMTSSRENGNSKELVSDAKKKRDKITSLDGLRGIACILVFNYHFFWPWTPIIMMGYGAFPPQAPEPYSRLLSLPGLCLLHRGRPMVAIFFAISGYVICRHILRSIHERRLDAAYKGLASSVFRRVFRLYIPPTISMFLVAVLAQMGAFRSEDDIYKGPDSVYINSTLTMAKITTPCVNGTVVTGAKGLAHYLGLPTARYLGNNTDMTDVVCVNSSTKVLGPSKLYDMLEIYDEMFPNGTTGLEALTPPHTNIFARGNNAQAPPYKTSKLVTDSKQAAISAKALPVANFTWVQLGGSWEEHPFIHPNLTYALQNFTRAYVEWANPFNFNHYHTRYDPHTFTIPMEFRGSILIYVFLLGTAALKANWRLGLGGLLAAYSLTMGRWDMAAFLGGALLSEVDIRLAESDPMKAHGSLDDRSLGSPATASSKGRRSVLSSSRSSALRWAALALALHFLSYPDSAAEYTPGFKFMSSLVPKYYGHLSAWMFYQSMGAVLLIPCVLRSPFICSILEGRLAQYLGRISFSFYLVHGPVLHGLGFWIMPRLFERLGRGCGYLVGWVVLMSVSLYLSHWWYKKIDIWSAGVGKRVEKALVY